MKLRSLLLAGSVLPLAFSHPSLAAQQTEGTWQLAQADVLCPEGEECVPLETLPAEPPLEGAEQVQPPLEGDGVPPAEVQQLPEEVPLEVLPVEPQIDGSEPPAEPPLEMDGSERPVDAPPVDDVQPPEAPPPEIEPVPPSGEVPPPGEMPDPDLGQLPPPEEIQPLPDETGMPPVEETTVEQQLERQGQGDEARRVRNLRERLLRQFEEVIAPTPDQPRRERRRGFQNFDRDDVVDQRGDSIIIDRGGGDVYVQPLVPDDADRLLYGAVDVQVQELEGGRTRTIVTREDGVKIITARDRDGNILRRVKRLPDGTDIVLIANPNIDGPQDSPIIRDIRRPRVTIPDDEYVVDLGRADYDQIYGALLAPPVAPIERRYSLDEVLRNEPVRAYSPRIDLDTITFDFGSATIGPDQMRSLYYLGQAMEDVLAERPDEVYLLEGHTDAVGSDYDNLILSDRRAEAVAVALSQNFDIPPENLVTQGYGERYLKIPTDGPERRNRRATVRRVTELLAQTQ